MAKFNKLDVPYQWKDEFTKYPHGYTIFEALCKWVKQVDEMVDNVNDWNDYLDNFVENFEFELQEEVQSTITRWQNEGILDDIINSALNTRLDTFEDETNAKFKDIAIYVEDFREDGKSDADVIQDTFNHVESLLEASGWRLRTQIYFGNGVVYKIDKPLHFRRHKYTTIYGYGSRIVVDSSVEVLPYMIDLSSEEGTYYVGQLRLKGLTFDANNNAWKIIQGISPGSQTDYGLYYTYIEDCSFLGLMEGSYAIHGLSWACFLKNNVFNGFGENPSAPGQWRGTALHIASAANGVYVTDCNFSRLDRVATGSSVKVTFKNNIIDSLKKSAFLMSGAGITIKDNYFEAVGGEDELVELYQQPSQSINAVIILRSRPIAWNFPVDTVNISNNTITNQKAKDFIALANAINVKVEHNYFSLMQKRENLVRLFGDGTGRLLYAVDGVKISNNTLYSTFSGSREYLFDSVLNFDLVELVGGSGLHGIVVKDVVQPNKRKLPINLYKNNFSEYDGNSNWNVTEELLNDRKVFKLEKVSNAYSNAISLKEYLNKLKGQYVRVSFWQQNTQQNATLRFTINDGVNSKLYIAGNSTSSLRYNEFLYKIDEDATDFEISFSTYASIGQSIYIADFSLTPAWYDLEMFG